MNIAQATETCLKKYFIFSGRAKRSEFWWFYLFTIIVGVLYTATVSAKLDLNTSSGNLVYNLTTVMFIIPTLAAGSRRLHDIGKSGWWLLLWVTIIGILLLFVWWAFDTKPEGDKYGEAVAETD